MSLRVLAFAAALVVPVAALPCEGMKQQVVEIKKVTVPELASLKTAGKVTIFDVNSAEFRGKNGIIPGAQLLTSSSQFDPAKELPAARETPLVFYCASTKCGASKKAAQRAIDAGWVDVSVLPEGLLGWRDAGQPTQSPPRS